jgi:hypothetical protein
MHNHWHVKKIQTRTEASVGLDGGFSGSFAEGFESEDAYLDRGMKESLLIESAE